MALCLCTSRGFNTGVDTVSVSIIVLSLSLLYHHVFVGELTAREYMNLLGK